MKCDESTGYPKDWKLRSRFVRYYRAKNKCEWCGASNRERHPVTQKMVTLTVAHVYDRNPANSSLLNLAALCNRCHLNHDRKPSKYAARRFPGKQGKRLRMKSIHQMSEEEIQAGVTCPNCQSDMSPRIYGWACMQNERCACYYDGNGTFMHQVRRR